MAKLGAWALVSLSLSVVNAQSDVCISLEGSTACPAFEAASVSINETLFGNL